MEKKTLERKRALVTGASRGIGRCVAERLKKLGVEVVTLARTDADIIWDVSFSRLPMALDNERFDILVNNAGGTLDIKDPFCGMEDWQRVLRVNLLFHVELINLLLPKMKEKGWGRIINICSTSSLENNGPVTYCSAKAALAAYTRSTGRVLAPTGVVMAGLIVGAINTRGGFWENQSKEHIENYLKNRCPLGEFMPEEAVAVEVESLCGEAGDYKQGALIHLDAGQVRGFTVP